MKKIHTRAKRRFRLGTHLNWQSLFHPEERHRPKTFKTEEHARAWASAQGLKPEQYHLKKVKRNKRFQVV